MKKLSLIISTLIIMLVFAACSPTPRAVTEDDLLLMSKMTALLQEARLAGVTTTVEVANGSGYEYKGDGWTAANGDILKSALYTYSRNPDTGAISFTENATAVIGGETQSLKFSVSGTVEKHTYSCYINGKPVTLDVSDFPVFS